MSASRSYTGRRNNLLGEEASEDALAIEHPLRISINQQLFTLTMQTPGEEKALARGLLFAEGVYTSKTEEPDYETIEVSDHGFVSHLNVAVEPSLVKTDGLNKRNLLSVASCGICGRTELPELKPNTGRIAELPSVGRVDAMYTTMAQHQLLFRLTGGVHAAAAFTGGFELIALSEDIGRHNAVDKVVGKLLQQQALNDAMFLLCSGRVSYEIVTKCFAAGIPVLCAVSAPSSLAVDFCKELGITLMAFCREGRFTRYA